MDPLVDAFHRISPMDHSLDGLPLTVVVVAFVIVVATNVALRFTGRSWRTWYWPAIYVLTAWWAGVNIGHSGFGSGAGMLWTVVLILILIDPTRRLLRAALVPVNRDGRR
jgi:hypothetical protein